MNTANYFNNRYPFSLLALLCAIAVWLFHSEALAADCPSIWQPHSPADEWVCSQMAAGKPANLKTQFPNEADRRLTSSFLEKMLTNPIKLEEQDYKVHIRHAILTEPLKVKLNEKTPISYKIELTECLFEDEVNFSGTWFENSVSFEGSAFKEANFSNAKFKEVSFEGSSFKIAVFTEAKFSGPINFKGIEISGNFVAEDAKFMHKRGPFFRDLVVGDNAVFNRAIFSGEIPSFKDAKIANHFWVKEAEFTNPEGMTHFSNMQVGGDVDVGGATFSGGVSFEGTDLAGDFLAEKARFTNSRSEATFSNIRVGGDVVLEEATFAGRASFNGAEVARDFWAPEAKFTDPQSGAYFSEMQVNGNVNLDGAEFLGHVFFKGTNVAGDFIANLVRFTRADDLTSILFSGIQIGGEANFHEAEFKGSVRFEDMHIARELLAKKAKFTNPKGMVEFSNIHVGGDMVVDEAMFSGRASFEGADVSGDFLAEKARFAKSTGEANFSHMQVGGDVDVGGATFSGEVSFEGTDLAGDFLAEKARFTNSRSEAKFSNIQVGGDVVLEEATFAGSAKFNGAEVARDLWAPEVKFTDPGRGAYFSEMQVDGDVILSGAEFLGHVFFASANVAGDFHADEIQISKGSFFNRMRVLGKTWFDNIEFKETVSMTHARFQSLSIAGRVSDQQPAPFRLDLSSAVVNGTLNIEGVVLQDLVARFLIMEGPLELKNLTFNGKVNLEHSSLNIFRLCTATLPEQSKFYGMTYQYISAEEYIPPKGSSASGGTCLRKEEQSELLKLPKNTEFTPSVYTRLEAFFERQGDFKSADMVFTDMKTREREVLSWLNWLWNLLLYITVNYGRSPERAFIWATVVLGFGCIVFRKDVMKLREKPDLEDTYPKYNSFWYSFDLFLPLVDLHFASVWVPKNNCSYALNYMRLHIILGLVLVPIALAAFTGIIS